MECRHFERSGGRNVCEVDLIAGVLRLFGAGSWGCVEF